MKDTPAYKCEICRQRASGDGALAYVVRSEVERFVIGQRRWREEHVDVADQLEAVRGAAFLSYPEVAKWHVVHETCPDDDVTERSLYWFDLSRAATWGQLSHWSAHLWGKEWFHDTGWERLPRASGRIRRSDVTRRTHDTRSAAAGGCGRSERRRSDATVGLPRAICQS